MPPRDLLAPGLQPVIRDGQQIGAFAPPQPGEPLSIVVNGPQSTTPAAQPRDLLAPQTPSAAGPDYNAGNAFQSGMVQGATMGFGDEILGTLMSPIEMGIDAVQGKPFDPGRSWNQAVDRARQGDAQMQAESPELALAGNIAGGLGTGVGLASKGVTLMNAAKPTIASMLPRAALEGAAYGAVTGLGTGDTIENKVAQAGQGAVVGGLVGGGLGAIGGMLANKSAQAAAGTVDDLTGQASTLYDAARQSGVVAPQQATQAMSQKMRDIATGAGVISPTGRVNSTYPEIAEVLRTMDDYALGTMDVPQMLAVRQTLSDAAKSQKPGERRIAVMMLEQFDNVTGLLAPEINQANSIYHRAMNADLLEEAILIARQKSGQYGQSLDKTLREQFGALERQIIKGDLRGFSQAEKDAISAVAQGGPIEGVLGLLGKMAPTGVVSAGLGGGVPFAVGTAIGGPAVGAAAGAGAMGVGLAARGAASAMTQGSARNAVIQSLIGKGASPTVNPALGGALQALIAGGGQQAGQVPSTNLMRMMAAAN